MRGRRPDRRQLAAERHPAGTVKTRDSRRDGTTHSTADRSDPERSLRDCRYRLHSGPFFRHIMAVRTRLNPDRANVIQEAWAVPHPKKTTGEKIHTAAVPLPYRDTALCLVRASELEKSSPEIIGALLFLRI